MVAAMPTQPGRRLSRRAFDPAFELAAAQVTAGAVPFVILGIADSAGTVRVEAFGPLDGERIGTDAICLLASITKPVVATAVMRQVEAGRISFDEPLAAWLPELARPGRLPFTAWHVLSHTSGLADLDLESLIARGGDRDELLRLTFALDQEAAPGERFAYASSPFDVLVEAVARKLGRPFEAILLDEVLDPLGMADTTFDPRPDRAARMAPVMLGPAQLAALEDRDAVAAFTRLHLAGGGLWSTVSDVLRFGRAMLCGGELDGARVLSPAFVALMTREVTVDGLGAEPDPLTSHHYALGWGKPGIASPASSSAFGHGGASGTRLWVDPAHDLVFVYLTGVWGLPAAPIEAVQHAVYAALS
jgi:CubicO group peptidase (beta-lactamase class C family)